MLSLFDFPLDLLGGIVFAWLDMRSIVRLDSAVCCTGHRAHFLAFLKSDHAILKELPPIQNVLKWATVRQVQCAILSVNVDVNWETLERYLRAAKPPVHVQLRKLKDSAYVTLTIAAHCRRTLCSMYCSNCSFGSSVGTVYACCSSLRDMFLYQCSVASEQFTGILCPHLKTLALMNCKCDDRCMSAAVAMCPNIVNLDIGSNNLSDAAVRDTVTKLTQLQKLSLYQLSVSDDTVVAVSAACCWLSAIDLGSCTALTDVAVTALATNCKYLTHIQMFGNTNYTRESLRAIALHCTGLKQCVFRKSIGACEEDEVLLFNSCRQLERVDMLLSSPASVSSMTPSIRQLTLYANVTTDAMLFAIGKYGKNLTKLSIKHGSPTTRMYTSRGLAAIAGGCRKLRTLILQGDTEQVTDLTLQVWRQMCPQLQVVGRLDMWEYYLFSPIDTM